MTVHTIQNHMMPVSRRLCTLAPRHFTIFMHTIIEYDPVYIRIHAQQCPTHIVRIHLESAFNIHITKQTESSVELQWSCRILLLLLMLFICLLCVGGMHTLQFSFLTIFVCFFFYFYSRIPTVSSVQLIIYLCIKCYGRWEECNPRIAYNITYTCTSFCAVYAFNQLNPA